MASKHITLHLQLPVLLFILFFCTSTKATRLVTPPKDKIDEREGGLAKLESPNEGFFNEENMQNLLGQEECEAKDFNECLRRRELADAHLDYIYTQEHHKP
ncbi:putative phytosulfokines 6 [Amborella trichopoda]|uniref:Phytosulfokine n=1 Tax=Amborella trichopoda TaxID=13333 RepID=W1PZZ5_AMBTC|nr:putative phytosulfokines 6 [Amborella trichopoda]ERN13180.1 hypothetical protein AMTR_s00040p00210670 [Amborella trichopoda]|eukprot:XP_006851713.1 putative phytosulfokines 6 [Amborella trichopoda]